MIHIRSVLIFIALLGVSMNCMATNGYFAIGYGPKSIGMGGASIAYPHDGLAAASNPAGMAFVEPGWDAGMRFINTPREAEINCRGVGACTQLVSDKSNRDLFLVPNFSYNKSLNDRMTFGVSVYGNGGINTSYGKALYIESVSRINGATPLAGGKLGVDFSQVILAPSLTYKINKQHTVGIAPLIAAQKFSSRGLEAFIPLSSASGSLTSRGSDWSFGLGFRAGWLYQLHPRVRVGAAYASKVYMTKFKKYDGLFANGGEFDIPSNFGFGIAFKLTDKLDLALDASRIQYGDIDALSNPIVTAAELGGTINTNRRLGGSDGIGFGWRSVWAFKAGLKYEVNDTWTFRTGYNHGEKQIPRESTLMNLISPAVPQDHMTFGVSYRPSSNTEISFAYMHAFENELINSSSSLGKAKAEISQNTIDINFSRRF